MPVSKLKVEIARLLRENHYVFDYKILDDGRHGVLRVYLKYHEGKPVIRHLERVSTPGRRRYVASGDIPGFGTAWGWPSSPPPGGSFRTAVPGRSEWAASSWP
jgi:ribosomal protein S8